MKKTITGAVALLAGAFVAHSQGTVSMANYLSLSTYIYVSLQGGANLGGHTGAATGSYQSDLANGNNWSVALYGNAGAGDAASTLTECTVAGGGFAVATLAPGAAGGDASAGTWYSSTIAQVPGTTGANQAATLQLYAWYNDGGTLSYAQAFAAGDPTGTSALATLADTGGNNLAGGPSITPPGLPSGLTSFTVAPTPEPSTIALGVMGASAFLLRLRRKK
ncbi:MAG TPA: hypothetical protein VH595_10465 [Verrucomicrobiae bacterium]|jgi:hypothetical protein|nr:hypothetical protein [Verrucomicrobiae bacterium]